MLCNVDWCLLFVKEGLMAPNHAFEIGLAPAVFAAQRKGYASHAIEKNRVQTTVFPSMRTYSFTYKTVVRPGSSR